MCAIETKDTRGFSGRIIGLMEKAPRSEEFAKFNALVGKVLSVPPETLKRRLEADRETYKPQKKKRKATKTPPR